MEKCLPDYAVQAGILRHSRKVSDEGLIINWKIEILFLIDILDIIQFSQYKIRENENF